MAERETEEGLISSPRKFPKKRQDKVSVLQTQCKRTISDEGERGKKNVITVSNATDRMVFVEMHPIEMVRKGNTQAFDLGLGMNAGTTNFAGTTIEVR